MNIFIKASLNDLSIKVLDKIKIILNYYNHTCSVCTEDTDMSASVEQCDMVITIGGDGTLLSIVDLAANYNKPILGINTGRVGFLAAVEGADLSRLNSFFENPEMYELKKHSLLKAKINNNVWEYCLNDVVISKNNFFNTISTQVYLNQSIISNFICDSIIISTSTGSTAYSLSAGGPIVDNELDILTLTPVADHNLNSSSIVLAKDKKIKIVFDKHRKQEIYVSFDGRKHTKITENDVVSINLSDKFVSIYSAKKEGQFEKVNNKLRAR